MLFAFSNALVFWCGYAIAILLIFMGAKNSFMKNNISVIHRKSIMDVMIYTFIDCQRFTIPSISIDESARAFLTHHNINEDEYSLEAVLSSYKRTRKQLLDEQKTDNQEKA